jgi:hypothetical protein
VGVMVGALAAWLVSLVYAVRLARAFSIWRARERQPHTMPLIAFLQAQTRSGDHTQDALRDQGRRSSKIFIGSGVCFIALVGLAVVIASVAHL